jgi:hypothetical protein
VKRRVRSFTEQSLQPEGLHVQEPIEPGHKRRRIDDPVVQLAIQDYFEKFGLHELSLDKVQAHVTSFIPERKPIRKAYLSSILKTQYHLTFKKLDPA